MTPTRRTQPFRASGSRRPSPALDAMRRGGMLATGWNPQDLQRAATAMLNALGTSRRPRRPQRPPRPPRQR